MYHRPDKLEEHLESRKRTVYLGVDPTAPSLHVGHLIPFMVLLHFQLRGHTALSLVSPYLSPPSFTRLNDLLDRRSNRASGRSVRSY